jgi:putative ABC transport system permease protein
LGTFIQDLRYGLRTLLKTPGFAVIAVATLALGIGANTAIFSVVNGILLKPLPYSDPDRLVQIREYHVPKHPDFAVSPGNFLEWQAQSTAFTQLAAYRTGFYTLLGSGEPERLVAGRVSAGLFTMLGVEPAIGRDFLADEDQPGHGNVVILSNRLWQRVFNGDPNILGASMNLSGNTFTVVGVMPRDFRFDTDESDLWAPIAFDQEERQLRGAHYINAIAQLKPGVSLDRAQAEMSAIASRLEQQYSDSNGGWGARVHTLLDYKVRRVKATLWVLLGAVGFVLLIACANVANLLLSRAATRRREMATRAALGAGRWRIARQLMTESILLAVLGGAAGLALAAWGVEALRAIAPENLPRVRDVGIDNRALLFTAAATLLTGLIFGLAPALHASRINLAETLKDSGRAGEGAGRQRLRGLLIVTEVALALILLVGGGLLLKSLWQLSQVDPGFDYHNGLVTTVHLPQKKYGNDQLQVVFFENLLRELSTLPGVQSAAGSNVLPIIDEFKLGFDIEGQPSAEDAQKPSTDYAAVTPGYFKTMGITVLRGREFTSEDNANSRRVAIINETMARQYFPGEDPIGKRINLTNGPDRYREIVGIVRDVKQQGPDAPAKPHSYEPFAQEPSRYCNIVLRCSIDPALVAPGVRAQVLKVDSEQPVGRFRTLEEILAGSVAQQRFSTLLLCIFASVALLLSVIGLYGVMAYSVAQRTHEIGLRMALGAGRRDVLRMVVTRGMSLTFLGVALGLAGAFLLTRLLSDILTELLFGVPPADPTTFAVIPAILALVALAACLLPAIRAARTDPMVALRCE